MKNHALLPALALIPALCAAQADAPPKSASGTLAQYEADLQRAPDDDALREKVIKMALAAEPKPALPKEAKKFMARGQAAVEMAKKAEDYADAAAEFEKAVAAAPWYADAYFNLGKVEDKAEQFEKAAKSLRWYLLAAPKAADAEKVEALIAKLEYKGEKSAKAKDHGADAQKLAGDWYVRPEGSPVTKYHVNVVGNSVEIVYMGFTWQGEWTAGDLTQYKGTLEGQAITGSYSGGSPGNTCFRGRLPFNAKVSADFSSIDLQYDTPLNTSNGCRDVASDWVLTR